MAHNRIDPKVAHLEEMGEEELFDLAFRCAWDFGIEEYRKIRRALAHVRGQTLEEELDGFEKCTKDKELVDGLRVMLGIEVREGTDGEDGTD